MVENIKEVLKLVYDPELGISIIDLGLVYDMQCNDGDIYIKMTLTTPGCPMHDSIVNSVKIALLEKLDIQTVNVDVVWEPQWTPEMISEEGKMILGAF
ncbi:metal-sulfur cluster assembly factor [Bacillus sp. FJAT-50079]|uniref:metal-sulfur cluster assembly factor n=1 Tax=Bacillus sp. FJAT-50079 TaxID=2833577 RepID=UPI001BC9B138|nr:metal-sulfur cluster assembly factor [Bacillus sp. FJAT-50079]